MKLFVLVVAILQVVAAAWLSVGSFENSDKDFTVFIQPAGWAFSIWGLIYLLSFIYAIYQILPINENNLLKQTRLPAALGFSGSILWLVFAGMTNWLIWFTVPTLMLMAFVFTMLIRADATGLSNRERFFSQTVLFPYAAWTAVAFWLNLQSVMAEEGLITSTTVNLSSNVALFFGLVLFTGYYVKRANFSVWYGGVLMWAAVGVIAANLQENGQFLFVVLAAVYGVFIFIGTLINKWRGRTDIYSSNQ